MKLEVHDYGKTKVVFETSGYFKMKNVLARTLLFSLLVFTLSSCANRKVNYMVAGTFISYGENNNYVLEVGSISEEQYENADGLNVIKDITGKIDEVYFSVELYIFDQDNNKELLSYYNLKDSQPETSAEPLIYVDDNSNYLEPGYPSYYGMDSKTYYMINYNNVGFALERSI